MSMGKESYDAVQRWVSPSPPENEKLETSEIQNRTFTTFHKFPKQVRKDDEQIWQDRHLKFRINAIEDWLDEQEVIINFVQIYF